MVMLGVTGIDRSVAFYQDEVGFAVQARAPGFAFLDAGSVTLVLSEGLVKATGKGAGAAELVIPVEHVREAHTDLVARGVVFTQEPRVVTGDRWAANFADPDGHLWSIFGAE